MSESIIQRRRALQRVLDEYPGCEFGFLRASRDEYFDIVYAVTPFLSIPDNCISLTLCYMYQAITGNYATHFYNNEKNYIAYYSNNVNTKRTLSIDAGSYKYVRMCFNLLEIDHCYIYDETNGQYLWKGKSVGGVILNHFLGSCGLERSAA